MSKNKRIIEVAFPVEEVSKQGRGQKPNLWNPQMVGTPSPRSPRALRLTLRL